MPLPQLQATSPSYSVNLTVIISVTVFCVSTMATIINLWGAKRSERIANAKKDAAKSQQSNEDLPGQSVYCKQQGKDLGRVEDLTRENKKNLEDAQKIVNQMVTQVATLENDNQNINKTMDEMKDNNKEIAKKLDDLLRQLMDWMNN